MLIPRLVGFSSLPSTISGEFPIHILRTKNVEYFVSITNCGKKIDPNSGGGFNPEVEVPNLAQRRKIAQFDLVYPLVHLMDIDEDIFTRTQNSSVLDVAPGPVIAANFPFAIELGDHSRIAVENLLTEANT